MPTKNDLVLQLHFAEDKCKELEKRLLAAEKERDEARAMYRKWRGLAEAQSMTHQDKQGENS